VKWNWREGGDRMGIRMGMGIGMRMGIWTAKGDRKGNRNGSGGQWEREWDRERSGEKKRPFVIENYSTNLIRTVRYNVRATATYTLLSEKPPWRNKMKERIITNNSRVLCEQHIRFSRKNSAKNYRRFVG
jgi:hypothetical protein